MIAEKIVCCMNNRCKAHLVLLDVTSTDRKRCVVCNSRLRLYNYKTDGGDFPPLVDNGTEMLLNGKPVLYLGDGTAYTGDDKPSSVDAQLGKGDPSVGDAMAFEVPKDHAYSDVKGCPIAPKGKIVVIPWTLFNTWVFLAKKIPVEWIAYLKGTEDKDGQLILDAKGMYFPVQYARSTHVNAERTAKMEEGTIGSVHSHVDMGVIFSQEDADHFNHDVDMVVNRRGELNAVTRVKLDCQRWARVQAQINLLGDEADVGALATLREKLVIEAEIPTKVDKAFTNGSAPTTIKAKGQHGIVVRDSRRFISEADEDERRYKDWQERSSGPDKTFKRVDGGRWDERR